MKYTHHDKKRPEWKKWFAWKPVPIGTHPPQEGGTMVWLEWIERKWLDCREGSNRYEYRLKEAS